MLTQGEFVNWQNYHSSLFPKFGDWFLGMLGEDREPQEAQEIRSKVWFDSLKRFNSDDLMAASVTLLKFPKSDKPKWFDDHLASLLEILNRPSARPELLRKRIQCELCRDTGIVDAMAIPGTAIFSSGGIPMPHGKRCAVDCMCHAAVWYPEDYKGPRRARFDKNTMVGPETPSEERSWEIIRDMQERGEWAKADAWERFLGGGRMPQPALKTA